MYVLDENNTLNIFIKDKYFKKNKNFGNNESFQSYIDFCLL